MTPPGDPLLAALLHEVGNLVFAAESQAEVLAAELDLPEGHPVRRHLAASRARFEALVRDVEQLGDPPVDGASSLTDVVEAAARAAPADWARPRLDVRLACAGPALSEALATLVHALGADRVAVEVQVFPREVRFVLDGPPGGPKARALLDDPFAVRAPGESRLAVARAITVLRAADVRVDAGDGPGVHLALRVPRVLDDPES